MPRIIAIDYGAKRTGLAWTDPMQLIATRLDTVPTAELEGKLKQLFEKEEIEAIVLGFPTRTDGTDTHITEAVRQLAERLCKNYPALSIHLLDERFTSKLAQQAILQAGVRKSQRRDKGLVDGVAATLLLQDFLESRG